MTTPQAIEEMMNAWNVIFATMQKKMPGASNEAIYQAAKAAMNAALKI